MQDKIIFICLNLALVTVVLTEDKPASTVFPDRTNAPGLKAPRKCWWAKEITPDLHVSGRLTERQIKYAADAGFKTILSLFTYPDSEPKQTFGGDSLPSTTESKKIVEDIAGMKFINLLDPMDEWASVEAVEKLTKVTEQTCYTYTVVCSVVLNRFFIFLFKRFIHYIKMLLLWLQVQELVNALLIL